jgi:hypothetical protein
VPTGTVKASAGDPQDPHVVGPPGSGSTVDPDPEPSLFSKWCRQDKDEDNMLAGKL